MEKNIGEIDKKLRILIAIILIIMGFYFSIWWLYLVAIIPIVTVLIGNCPVYSILKIKTCKNDKI